MKEVAILFLYEVLALIICFYAFGLILWLLEKLIVRNLGKKSNLLYRITGIIGTTIHEISHAIFCVIFGHRIERIKFFDLNPQDGTYGFVEHSYKKRNLYQRIGNFFIGIAPLILGGASILLLMFLLLRNTFNNIMDMSLSHSLSEIYVMPIEAFAQIFTITNMKTWQFYVFLLVSICIAVHMNISSEDLKGSLTGIVILIVLIVIIDIPLYFLDSDWPLLVLKRIIVFEVSIFSIVFAIDIVMIVLSTLFYFLKKIFNRNKQTD